VNISPTQIKKFRDCRRIIGFEYVENLKAPPSTKQQFGTDVHAQLERWLREGIPPDKTPAGKVAQQGIRKGWLPTPGPELLVEHEILYDWLPGVAIHGYCDCAVPPREGDPPLVIDHKTTSSMKWTMTPAELENDPQGLIYATWAMLHWSVPVVQCRWMYYAASAPSIGSRKPRGAKPVSAVFEAGSEGFESRIRSLDEDIRKIAEIRGSGVKGLDLPPNAGSCGKYGGCFYQDRCRLEGADRLASYIERDRTLR